MCGRYQFTSVEMNELLKISGKGSPDLSRFQPHGSEICPTDLAPVLVPAESGQRLIAMRWGFPRFNGSGVVINARCETVLEKRLFRESVLQRRCVVPSSGFFEWSHSGLETAKYLFTSETERGLYMAGFWSTFCGVDGRPEQHFVILTTAANDSLLEEERTLFSSSGRRLMHDRMPVVLTQQECAEWLSKHVNFDRIFHREHILLQKQNI